METVITIKSYVSDVDDATWYCLSTQTVGEAWNSVLSNLPRGRKFYLSKGGRVLQDHQTVAAVTSSHHSTETNIDLHEHLTLNHHPPPQIAQPRPPPSIQDTIERNLEEQIISLEQQLARTRETLHLVRQLRKT